MSAYKIRSTVEHNLKLNKANTGVFTQNAGKEIKFQAVMNQ